MKVIILIVFVEIFTYLDFVCVFFYLSSQHVLGHVHDIVLHFFFCNEIIFILDSPLPLSTHLTFLLELLLLFSKLQASWCR